MEAWQGDYARRSYGYSVFTQDIPPSQSGLALTICRKEEPRWKICGIPEVLYTDNGSDFTSRHLEQVSADLKIQLVFSTPGVPRGRGRVERFFSTIDQEAKSVSRWQSSMSFCVNSS